jgi:hypothetical protein
MKNSGIQNKCLKQQITYLYQHHLQKKKELCMSHSLSRNILAGMIPVSLLCFSQQTEKDCQP